MPTTTTVSSNYAGKVAGQIIGKAFKQADTLRLNLVTVAQNVNYKYNLRKIRLTDGTTDYTCGHTPAGSITLSEKVIQPEKFKNDSWEVNMGRKMKQQCSMMMICQKQ